MMEKNKELFEKIATLKVWGNHLLLGFIICSVLFELNKITKGKTDWYINCIILAAIIHSLHLLVVIIFQIKKKKGNQ